MSNHNIEFYNFNSDKLEKQYRSVSFNDVHSDWLFLLEGKPGLTALDIGAGIGRDAKALYHLQYAVTAVEPADGLREKGVQFTDGCVKWIDDTLPNLSSVVGSCFDLVLISAVWMHLSQSDQHASLKRLSKLINMDGLLVISLRFGEFDDERSSVYVDADNTKEVAKTSGFTCVFDQPQSDALVRENVYWRTLVFRRS